MILWKQRLYAFLLRRILGPFLCEESLRQLHECIEVSFQEGTFVLKDVALNAEYITAALLLQQQQQQSQSSSSSACGFPVRLRRATVDRLEIQLRLMEGHVATGGNFNHSNNNESDENDGQQQQQGQEQEQQSSLAWRALKLGTTMATTATTPTTTEASKSHNSTTAATSTGGVSLVAHVVIDGVVLVFEPNVHENNDNNTNDDSDSSSASAQDKKDDPPADAATAAGNNGSSKGMLASYLDAALASLRLSVQIQNVSIRISTPSTRTTSSSSNSSSTEKYGLTERWIEVRLKQASFYDAAPSDSSSSTNHPNQQQTFPYAASVSQQQQPQPQNMNNSQSNYRTVLHKALDLKTLTILTGEEEVGTAAGAAHPLTTTTLALLEGASHIGIRVVEYTTNTSNTTAPPLSAENSLSIAPPPPRKVQQDIQINIQQKLNVFVDEASLLQVQLIVNSLQNRSRPALVQTQLSKPSTRPTQSNTASSLLRRQHNSALKSVQFFEKEDDEDDVKAMDGILKQYQQARLAAERNEVRGGILLVSDDCDDECGDVTFDAFFDANEQSLYHLSTVLRESFLGGSLAASLATDNDNSVQQQLDSFVHTKIHFHLKEAGVKISFGPPLTMATQCAPLRRPDEYMLLTLSDWNVSSSFSNTLAEHTVSITHLDMEDSQLDRTTQDAAAATAPDGLSLKSWRMEIGNLLRFPRLVSSGGSSSLSSVDDGSMADYNGYDMGGGGNADSLLLEAPCISIHAKTQKRRTGTTTTAMRTVTQEIEFMCEPVEFTYRHATVANLTLLAQSLVSAAAATAKTVSENDKGDRKDMVDGRPIDGSSEPRLTLRVALPSISIVIPVLVERDWTGLYERCGYSCDWNLFATRSSIGFLLDSVSVEYNNNSGDGDGDNASTTGELLVVSFHHFLVYANSPVGKRAVDRKIQQLDIVSVSGRTEVNPILPVSIQYCKQPHRDLLHPKNVVDNAGTRSFPIVPAISSFKARQQDEDEDNRVDRVLSSKLENLNVGTRKELRENDPQANMLAQASKADAVVVIEIPEIVGDLSTKELSILKDMLDCLLPPSDRDVAPAATSAAMPTTVPEPVSPPFRIGIAFNCETVSLALHGAEPIKAKTPLGKKLQYFSYMVKVQDLKSHFLLEGTVLNQARLLTKETDFFEISNLFGPKVSRSPPLLPEDRRNHIRTRSASKQNSHTTPIFYRSHLFSPISRQSPSILFDFMNLSQNEQDHALAQKNVYITLYDTSYRFDIDSEWISRCKAIVSKNAEGPSESSESQGSDKAVQTMTRLFVSVADCNIDYQSSPRFKTASRTILRIGDFRVSSNIMWPAAPVQAFSISLGDVAVYLCNSRFPYNFENSRLLRSDTLMKPEQVSLACISLPDTAHQEAVLRAMNYRTMLMLDSTEAVVAVSNAKPKKASDPVLRASFTVGEISLFACKDSFRLFLGSISEPSVELTAIDDKALHDLKVKTASLTDVSESEAFFDPVTEEHDADAMSPKFFALDDLRRQSALRPAATRTTAAPNREKEFLLDGYDWTTIEIDASSSRPEIPHGQEQTARWYGTDANTTEEIGFLAGHGSLDSESAKHGKKMGPTLIHHHFPLHPVSDPLADGDMGAAKYAGTGTAPQVQTRVVVHDFRLKLRFFDGYDWPELLDAHTRSFPRKGAFIIDEDGLQKTKGVPDDSKGKQMSSETAKRMERERKAKLLGDLLEGSTTNKSTFKDLPLPEERGATLKEQAECRKLARRTGKYFQFSASGISLRLDSMQDSSSHNLASCMNVKVQDFFLAESISKNKPVKMAGEWFNETDHPRDTKDGLFMMKMVTWHPHTRVTPDNAIANDICEAAVKILPLRCFIDQIAIRFASAFFASDKDDNDNGQSLPAGLHSVPPPFLRVFRVKPFKMKIDYTPQKIDGSALWNGAYVELINLSPLDGLVLTLKQVEVKNEIGFGAALSILIRSWIQDICATQLLKFLATMRPLEPIVNVGGSAVDVVVLPWEAYRNGESVPKAIRSGAQSFADAVTYEALTNTSRLADFFTGLISRATTGASGNNDVVGHGSSGGILPTRPAITPRNLKDTMPHSVESLARGLQEANYKVVIIPYREFHRSGPKGAAKSVLKGIPVAISAPASGVAEAISFTLLGARNHLRPDIRKEEEISQRGLHMDSW